MTQETLEIDGEALFAAFQRGEVEIVHGARDARIEEIEAQLAAIKSEVEKALGLNFSTAKLAVSRVILSYRDWVESAKEMEDIAEKRRERIAELEARAEAAEKVADTVVAYFELGGNTPAGLEAWATLDEAVREYRAALSDEEGK